MAIHWGPSGQVDGYMSRTIGAFLMPLVLTGIILLFIVIPKIDPLRANIEKFRKHYDGFFILLSIFLLAIHLQILLWNIGIEISPNKVMPIGLGLLFFYIGILCEGVKRNWFLGIRTPWTLSNEIVWEKTHKAGAKLFKIVGMIVFTGFFFPRYAIFFVLAPILLAALYTIIYSYVEYRKVQKSDTAKEKYLLEVEKALAEVRHPRSKEVLDDVRVHLDRRFAELGPDKQMPEDFQKIIDEMGPPSDYAELLEPDTAVIRRNIRQKYILWTTVVITIIALMILSIAFTDGENASVPNKIDIEENRNTDSEKNEEAIKSGIDSAQSWLQLVDDQLYSQSWEQAAESFKEAVNRDQWINSLNAVRKPLGKVLSREVFSKKYAKELPGAPDGEYVVILLKTSFENKKSAIETVTPMLDKNGNWRVSGYYIK